MFEEYNGYIDLNNKTLVNHLNKTVIKLDLTQSNTPTIMHLIVDYHFFAYYSKYQNRIRIFSSTGEHLKDIPIDTQVVQVRCNNRYLLLRSTAEHILVDKFTFEVLATYKPSDPWNQQWHQIESRFSGVELENKNLNSKTELKTDYKVPPMLFVDDIYYIQFNRTEDNVLAYQMFPKTKLLDKYTALPELPEFDRDFSLIKIGNKFTRCLHSKDIILSGIIESSRHEAPAPPEDTIFSI